MRGRDAREAHEDVVDAAGKFTVPAFHERFDFLTLEVFAGAADALGGKRIASDFRELLRFGLANVGERPDDDALLAVVHEYGRHCLQTAAVKKIEEQRADDVVHVMAESNFVAALFARNTVENAAAQARAERANVLPFRNQLLNQGIRVLILNVIGNA